MNDATRTRATHVSDGTLSVIVDGGAHALANLGDVAMLQVAVRRIRELFPAAAVRVLTDAPERLARFCPSATPLPAEGLRSMNRLGYLPGRFRLPRRLSSLLAPVEAGIRRRNPEILDAMAARRARRSRDSREGIEAFRSALDQASLVVLCGGGYLCDAFRNRAVSALELLRRVQRRGRPTALFGQGLGPITDGPLRQTARAVLPRARLIAVREDRSGTALLRSLGVAADRVAVTGDDAIEPAFGSRLDAPGRGLGVNLRLTAYSSLDTGLATRLGATLRGLAREFDASLVAIPISLSPDSDLAAIDQALGSQETVEASQDADEPSSAIAAAGRCRLVVTASYHAAVFALSQGIPAVGLVRSAYYSDKFLGLAQMFGAGCRVMPVEGPEWPGRLETAARELWEGAQALRPGLLEAASRQVETGRRAYARLTELV